MMFRGSPEAAAHVGKYPKTASDCLPLLVPWQRKQFSYWFTAGFTTVVPSVALMPTTPDWDPRISGGAAEVNEATANDACESWQSTQVACRLLFNNGGSAASWVLVPDGNGCAILANQYE